MCLYLRLRYLTLIISTDKILRMAAQFFISLCWLFWAVMYSFIFILRTCFVNLIQFWGTNKVFVVAAASLPPFPSDSDDKGVAAMWEEQTRCQ